MTLKQLREGRGWALADVVKAAKKKRKVLTVSTVSRAENTGDAAMGTAEALAAAYGLDIAVMCCVLDVTRVTLMADEQIENARKMAAHSMRRLGWTVRNCQPELDVETMQEEKA